MLQLHIWSPIRKEMISNVSSQLAPGFNHFFLVETWYVGGEVESWLSIHAPTFMGILATP